jgi:hypothetical protein
MKTYQIDILNPKAIKLLQDLADLNLISFKKTDESLKGVVSRLRKRASVDKLSLDDITKEVEIVRSKRYAKKSE